MAAKKRKRAAKKQRRYSDEDRANALAALAANGGNVSHTAKQLGVPEGTLRRWMTGQHHPEAAQSAEQKKGPLSDGFEEVARMLLGGVTPEKIACADVTKLLTAAAIAVDKMRLLREQPTTINKNDTPTLTPEERAAAIRAVLARLGDTSAGPLGVGAGNASGSSVGGS